MRAVGQAGFRVDYRCSDHLLVLRTLIEQQRERNAPLFTCFVDFRKAYDSVPRDLLWQKLAGLGIQVRVVSQQHQSTVRFCPNGSEDSRGVVGAV